MAETKICVGLRLGRGRKRRCRTKDVAPGEPPAQSDAQHRLCLKKIDGSLKRLVQRMGTKASQYRWQLCPQLFFAEDVRVPSPSRCCGIAAKVVVPPVSQRGRAAEILGRREQGQGEIINPGAANVEAVCPGDPLFLRVGGYQNCGRVETCEASSIIGTMGTIANSRRRNHEASRSRVSAIQRNEPGS